MTKTYTFYKNSWWDSSGCSCCDPTEMIYYESDDTDPTLGTTHSRDDCYVDAIVSHLGRDLISDEVLYELYEYSFEKLLALSEKLGIIVEIVEEEND